jgi:dihydroorotase
VEDVVARPTVEPAMLIGRAPGLGTLQVGAPAEIARDLGNGSAETVDTRQNMRRGDRRLAPVLTIRGGRPFGHPPLPIPFVF